MNPNMRNLKISIIRQILIKPPNPNTKKESGKKQEKTFIMCKGSLIRITADFQSETMEDRRLCDDIFKVMKEKKNC